MMKKNREISSQIIGVFLLTLSLMLVSCGPFQATSYYGDGIYGEELPIERTERVVYNDDTNYGESATDPNYYRSYFDTMASKVDGNTNIVPYFSNIDSYQSPQTTSDTQNSRYAGWGQNKADNVIVNVYDNYNTWGYSPYYDNWNYGNTYYWGMGAWSPYYRYNRYQQYGGFHIGYNWNYGWNYPYEYGYYGYNPYYPYFYNYRPYYYDRYYPYYGNVYRNSKNYAYIKGRRGGNNASYYNNSNPSNYSESNRTYSRRSYSRGSGTYTPTQRSYSRQSTSSTQASSANTGRTYSRNSSSSTNRNSYESSNSSSGRTYTPRSSSSSDRSYSRKSSSGRTYSSGRRGR